jgi:LPXTG-site transpeptidase (sortase) family protein
VKLARINTALLCAIILINGFIIVMPFVPALHFWWQSRSDTRQKLTEVLHAPAAQKPAEHPQPENIPDGNRLVIPAMMLDSPFFEGASAQVLNQGPWLRPHTSTPENGGNTVIAAHRFTYTDPEGDFYHLDRLKIGDEIGVFKDKRRYLYTVTSTKVVKASALEVEAPSDTPQLTLYTCTPLWLPKDRLVVIATLQTPNLPAGESQTP